MCLLMSKSVYFVPPIAVLWPYSISMWKQSQKFFDWIKGSRLQSGFQIDAVSPGSSFSVLGKFWVCTVFCSIWQDLLYLWTQLLDEVNLVTGLFALVWMNWLNSVVFLLVLERGWVLLLQIWAVQLWADLAADLVADHIFSAVSHCQLTAAYLYCQHIVDWCVFHILGAHTLWWDSIDVCLLCDQQMATVSLEPKCNKQPDKMDLCCWSEGCRFLSTKRFEIVFCHVFILFVLPKAPWFQTDIGREVIVISWGIEFFSKINWAQLSPFKMWIVILLDFLIRLESCHKIHYLPPPNW